MIRRFFFIVSILFLAPVAMHAATPDIGVRAADISFSEAVLVSGDQIRIYSTLRNMGDTDITGYIFFYQGVQPIGASQVVTLVAGGENEEVWVDFTVPYNAFNIRAEVKGSEPQDVNPDNDLAITSLFYPIVDEDRDGIEDETDNCPEISNADQADADSDGIGDVCDDDDDNDGLTDDVEAELGTDPKDADTDNDGSMDAQDSSPLDPEVQNAEPVLIAEAEPTLVDDSTVTVEEDTFADSSADSVIAGENSDVEDLLVEVTSDSDVEVDADSNMVVSSNTTFGYTQEDWKTYNFEVLAPNLSGMRFLWDFGDGVTSAQSTVSHKFRSAGKYVVTLVITDSEGNSITDSKALNISFFHIANPLVKITIGLLALIFIGSSILALKRSGRQRLKKVDSSDVARVHVTSDELSNPVPEENTVADDDALEEEDEPEEDESSEEETEEEIDEEIDEDKPEVDSLDEEEFIDIDSLAPVSVVKKTASGKMKAKPKSKSAEKSASVSEPKKTAKKKITKKK
ncbi:MAG: PKD domain-containing protein [Candidatus Uhrbacteria bacterium]|nr:PKD domain-containing protein [Candidatus Uhrbacteria bacterium]